MDNTGGWMYCMLGQATLEGPDLPPWRLERKLAACLAYLALEGATYRSRLVGLLWPESPEATARNNLSQLLRKVRLTAGADLLGSGDLLALSDEVSVDARSARDLYAQGLYADMLALEGDVLAGLNYDDCPELDDWVQSERQRWLEWRATALREETARLEHLGAYEAALERVRQLLDLDPVSEEAYRRSMKLHYLRGDRAAALKAYQRCREVLHAEFGSGPLPETEELAREIDRGSVPVPPAVSGRQGLPLSVLRPPVLVGREREWAQMEAAWQQGALFIYLRGAPGSGKTRLAMDFAASKGQTIVYGGRPGDQKVPFASSARNIRTTLAQLPPQSLEPWVQRELSRIVPELARPGEDAPPPMTSEEDVLRYRQASQLFFGPIQIDIPTVVIDDWQFYDYHSNLDGIYMWTTPPPAGVQWRMPRMIVTYRRDEVEPASESLILQQVEQGAAVMIDIEPLPEADLNTLMDEIDVPADPEARARLVRHTGGNPLFLLETVKLLIETDQLRGGLPDRLPLPEKVWQLIEKRMGLLSPQAVQAARAAAVLGRDFDVALVADVLGAPVLGVADAWQELEDAQIMRGNAFWHDLVYEAVLGSVPSSLQPILHRNAARTLERTGGDPARIAQHWLRAGSPAEAIPNLYAAEQQARGRFLNDEAAAFRQQREALLRELGAAAPAAQNAATYALPVTPEGFFGREAECAALRDMLLGQTPLVTLLGPGGVGKTRLSIEVGRALQPDFSDGVVFVSLAPVRDAGRVLGQIARSLGLQENTADPVMNLRPFLQQKRVLLLLDNFEHVLNSAGEVAALLRDAPHTRALATSRAPLRVSGERLYPVEPLPLPRRGESWENPAVQLFVQRARELRPDFELTDDNAYALSSIVHRLDGLPLALELAAARLRVLSPSALLARLEKVLPLLSHGARDVPQRQQTLRAAVAWSDDLLPDAERRLFRQLAVFQGGWTLEAAEVVTGASDQLDVLESLSALIDHSLVRVFEVPGGEPRYIMLSTIREYALEQLVEHGELAAAQEKHAQYVLDFARRARAGRNTPMQARWVQDVDAEGDNIRAAGAYLLERGRLAELAELGWNIAVYIWILAHLPEGEMQMTAVLSHPDAVHLDPHSLARARAMIGLMRLWQYNREGAREVLEAAVPGFQQVADEESAAECMVYLSLAVTQMGDLDTGERLARANVQRAAHLSPFTLGLAHSACGFLCTLRRDPAGMHEWYSRVLALSEPRHDHLNAQHARTVLAVAATLNGQHAEAAAHLQLAYQHARAILYRNGQAMILESYGLLSMTLGCYELVARLHGASEALRETINIPNWIEGPLPPEQTLSTLQEALGERFDLLVQEGRSLDVQSAMELAVQSLHLQLA